MGLCEEYAEHLTDKITRTFQGFLEGRELLSLAISVLDPCPS